MSNEKIRIDVDANSSTLNPVIGQLERAERALDRLDRTSQRMRRNNQGGGGIEGMLGGSGGGGGRGGGRGRRPAGGGGGGGGVGGNLLSQIGGLAGGLGIGYLLHSATRFNSDQLRSAAGLGVNPFLMGNFNRAVAMPGFGLSSKLALSKENVAGGFSAFAGEGDFSAAQRDMIFRRPEMAGDAMGILRGRGVDTQLGMGAMGTISKTFNLGPESVDVISKALARGADMSGLARSEDFVRIVRGQASAAAGRGGTFDQLTQLTAALQQGAGREFRGDKAAGLQNSLQGLFDDYVTKQGAGLDPYMRSIMNGIGTPEEAFNMGSQAFGGKLAGRLGQIGSKYRPGQRPSLYGSRFNFSADDSYMFGNIAGDPNAINSLMGVGSSKYDYAAIGKQEDERLRQMRGTRGFRAEQAQINVGNAGYEAANATLGGFEGKLHEATIGLGLFTAALYVSGGGRLMGGMYGGGRGGGMGMGGGGGMLGGMFQRMGGWYSATNARLAGVNVGMPWRASSTLVSRSVMGGMPGESGFALSTTLGRRGAGLMNRAAIQDAVSLTNLGRAARGAGGLLDTVGAGLASFVNPLNMAVAAVVTWGAVAMSVADKVRQGTDAALLGYQIGKGNAPPDADRAQNAMDLQDTNRRMIDVKRGGIIQSQQVGGWANFSEYMEGLDPNHWAYQGIRGGMAAIHGAADAGQVSQLQRRNAMLRYNKAHGIQQDDDSSWMLDKTAKATGTVQKQDNRNQSDNRTYNITINGVQDGDDAARKTRDAITNIDRKDKTKRQNEADSADSANNYLPGANRNPNKFGSNQQLTPGLQP